MVNKDYKVSDEEKRQYLKLIDIRKKKRMPIKYILGTLEFMGIPFKNKGRSINSKTRYRNFSREKYRNYKKK